MDGFNIENYGKEKYMQLNKLAIIGMIAISGLCHAGTYRAIDGDTIDTGIKPFQELKSIKLRILGVDSPEIHGKCPLERQKAQEAKKFIQQKLNTGKIVQFNLVQWDKYGGRVDGDVIVDGISMSEELISTGHAIKYDGGKKIKDWCK